MGSATENAVCGLLGPALRAKPQGSVDTMEEAEFFTKVLEKVPPELEADVRFLDEISKKNAADPASVDKSLAGKITESATRLFEWTATNCIAEGPYWACLTQSKFEPVGKAINDFGFASRDGFATPEEAAVPAEAGSTRVEISRTDTLVEFQYLDGAGRVTNIRAVKKDETGWIRGSDRACRKI